MENSIGLGWKSERIKNCEEMKKWRMEREILCPQNFHNTFKKKKKIISDRLLQVVIGEQKSNFNGKFKLELIIIYQI